MASYATRSSPVDKPYSKDAWQGTANSSRVYHHIKDIIAVSKPRFDQNASLQDYLAECEKCLQAAKGALEFGRPDQAFRNYLTASEIGINLIPRHRDHGFLHDNNRRYTERYSNVRRGLKLLDGDMDDVRRVIEDNNSRYATQPTAHGPRSAQEHVTTNRQPSQVTTTRGPTVEIPDSLRIERARPASSSHVPHSIASPTSGSDDLHSRLARLRMSSPQTSSSPVFSLPKTADYGASNGNTVPVDNLSGYTDGTMPKPAGPRDMPVSLRPSIPPKIPMAGYISMPKPPSPTYTPSMAPNGYNAEPGRPAVEKRQTYYDQPIRSIPPQVQRAKEENPYRPRTPNGYHAAMVAKSRSSDIPFDTMITASTLDVYLRKYNVLLIDVRERVQFDEGHIFATSIICLEPASLKEGISAEALEDRLILSPEAELNLFSRRNEFDLVVYYDQSAADDRYLRGAPTQTDAPHLRALFDTLYEFNEYKPLKDGRPPALLQGGLDAWIDLMGGQCLASSRTAIMLGSTRQRVSSINGRSAGRQRIASTNSRYEIRNRRLRDHKFLDEKEQAAWREKVEQEQVTTDGRDSYYNEDLPADDEPASPFVPDYEAFLRRFPAIDQQSMSSAPERPMPPTIARRTEHGPPPIPSRPPPAIPRPSYSGQSEIIQTQAPLARVNSSVKQPLYNSALAARTKKIPMTGLTNFGVTCYMNSTLQCLSSTIPLAQFFMDEPRYRHNVQKNWKGSSGIMPEVFANVVRSLWKGDVQVIKPTTFRNFCGRMNREWVIDRQQDAKEFFDFLVDCLHEDLNLRWERNPLRPLTSAEEMQREKYSIADAGPIEWERYEHRDYSFISSLFAGQHASRVKCLTCRNTSTTYEAFYSISIEIPRTGSGDIYQCLRSYTQEERLSEMWVCPYCKCERQATKQIILTRLPQFLVIHFKRFSASKTERARKIHTPINFPLHGLQMDQFVVPHAAPSKPQISESGVVQLDPAITPPFAFDAYGVLRHLGNSGDGGHYVSIVRDPGRNCWRKFDDERHYDLDPQKLGKKDSLQNSEAYIVFYQRSMAR